MGLVGPPSNSVPFDSFIICPQLTFFFTEVLIASIRVELAEFPNFLRIALADWRRRCVLLSR
jgi:hypothetical protein